MFHRRTLLAAVGAALALTCALPHAQDKFPSRPIELIVPTPPGGGVDIVARMLGELAEPVLGVKVVVVNKPGGTGAIGVAQLTQAKPDGYTLAVVWNAPLTVTPHTLAVSYTLDDYTPISQLTGGTPFVFCVKPEFPALNQQHHRGRACDHLRERRSIENRVGGHRFPLRDERPVPVGFAV